MLAGILILAIAYGWTANWSDELGRFFHLSMSRSGFALTANGGVLRIDVFLATLAGAALIAMGLSCANDEAAATPDRSGTYV
jgi:hypothetical protein